MLGPYTHVCSLRGWERFYIYDILNYTYLAIWDTQVGTTDDASGKDCLVAVTEEKQTYVGGIKLNTDNSSSAKCSRILVAPVLLILLSETMLIIPLNCMSPATTFGTDIWLTKLFIVSPDLSVFLFEMHLCRVALART